MVISSQLPVHFKSFYLKQLRTHQLIISNKMSPSTSSLQGVDPSASGTIIRGALAFESVFTLGVGAYYMFFPRHFFLSAMGTTAAQVTTTAVQVAQQFGAVNVLVGATVGLLVPNTRTAIECRPIFYRVALAFEFLFAGILGWQAFTMDGMPKQSLLAGVGQLSPFIAWRIFTLLWKPEWFGRYLEGKKVN